MKKKILVVGGAGYVGGVIVDLLLSKKKYDITVFDNLLYEESYRKNCKFIYGDIRDKKFYKPKLNSYDVIVWLAALVGDGACSINPDLTDEINFQTLKKLCKIYKKRIVFIRYCHPTLKTMACGFIKTPGFTLEILKNKLLLITYLKKKGMSFCMSSHHLFSTFHQRHMQQSPKS